MWQVGVLICLGWLVSLCLHEFSHALIAYWGGDTSVKMKGYLTLNPLKYADPTLSLIYPMIFLIIGGIGLPGGAVYINKHRLLNKIWESLTSIAGPLANLILAVLLAIVFNLLPSTSGNVHVWLTPTLAFLICLQIYAFYMNLLPLPPLDGFGVIAPFLPVYIKTKCYQFSAYSLWIILGLFWFCPPFAKFFVEMVFLLAQGLGISPEDIGQGFLLFNQPITKLM